MKKVLITIGIILILGMILTLACQTTGLFKKNNSDLKMSVQKTEFFKEYPEVNKEHKFEYASLDKVFEIINGGDGIIFFSFKVCPWCQVYAPVLDKVTREQNIDKVYYYDPKDIRKEDTKEYKELIAKLGEYLDSDEEGNKRLYVPHVFAIKGGVVVGENNSMSTMKGNAQEYFTKEKEEELKTILEKIILDYKNTCVDSKGGKGC